MLLVVGSEASIIVGGVLSVPVSSVECGVSSRDIVSVSDVVASMGWKDEDESSKDAELVESSLGDAGKMRQNTRRSLINNHHRDH